MTANVDCRVYIAGLRGETTSPRLGEMHAWGTQPELAPTMERDGVTVQPKYDGPQGKENTPGKHWSPVVVEASIEQEQYAWLYQIDVQYVPECIEAVRETLTTLSIPSPTIQATVIEQMAQHREKVVRVLENIAELQPEGDGIHVFADALCVKVKKLLDAIDEAILLVKQQQQPKDGKYFAKIGRVRQGQ
jgi:hypothetical protein